MVNFQNQGQSALTTTSETGDYSLTSAFQAISGELRGFASIRCQTGLGSRGSTEDRADTQSKICCMINCLIPLHRPADLVNSIGNTAPRSQRRLTAIVFADVAGFSRLVERDDVQTILKWNALKRDLIEPKIEEYSGRLLRKIGDGLFIAFDSVVDSVLWARDVQRAITAGPQSGQDEKLQVRIGINVEDALIDDNDLHGDGVNIAARIHDLAEPGDTVVTATVRDYIRNKLDVGLADLGEHQLKNISRPLRIFRLEDSTATSSTARRVVPHLTWSKRPSVAVLPFRNLGGDPREDYFGEGITEDIITALSRNRSLFVIARNSTLHFRDDNSERQQMAARLGVRYFLEGSVRRQAEVLKISAKLVDTSDDGTIWAENYQVPNNDLFAVQEAIAAKVVARIEPPMYRRESELVRRKPPESMGAYDCVLRALPLLHAFDNQKWQEAATYLDRAIELDPGYAQAHAYRAWLYLLRIAEARSNDIASDSLKAKKHAQLGMDLDAHDSFALAVAAHVHALLHRQPEVAAEFFERSLEINENSAFAWGMSGLTYCYLGQPDEALTLFGRAAALAESVPGAPHPRLAGVLNDMAQIHISQRRFAQAEPLVRRAAPSVA